jgi:hypothetical protein
MTTPIENKLLIAVVIMRGILTTVTRINLDAKKNETVASGFLDNHVYIPLIQQLNDHQRENGLEGAPQTPEDLFL